MSNVYTSTDYTLQKQKEKQREQFENMSILATSAGLGYAGIKYGNDSQNARDFFSYLPGANRYAAKNQISYNESIAQGLKPIDVRHRYTDQSIGRSLNSLVSSIEELSSLSLLKTLQISNFVEPFTDISTSTLNKQVHITSDAVDAFSELYNAQMLKQSKGNRGLRSSDIKRGFMLEDGVLYAIKPDGSIDYVDPVLRNTKLVTSNVKIGDHYSPNKILEKYANTFDIQLNRRNYKNSNLVAIGAESKLELTSNWAKSYFRYAMEIGYKSMDNPLGGVEELLSATGLGQTSFFENPTYQKVKKALNVNLGTNGNYNLSTPDSLKIMTKNIVGKSAISYLGYQGINSVLGALTTEDNVWHNGLLSGLTATFANTRIKSAEILADPFQKYKEAQEQAAPDSTNITTLIGFPLAGAMMGASYEYYKRMYKSGTQGIEAASLSAATNTDYGFMNSILKPLGFKDTSAMKSKAIIGGVIGSALTLPFLPGALIGKSSDELREEYSGEKEVENRTNAGWIMGGGKFEGDNVKNFQASWVARTLLNIRTETRYGSEENKRAMDPLLHPFKYLSNPYRYEQMHSEDSPYPVWGMDVTYGSFLGKAYQATIGEVIKPTVINPEFISQMNSQIQQEREVLSEGTGIGTDGEMLGTTLPNTVQGQFSTSYSIPMQVRPKERSLINEGLMLSPESPSNNPMDISRANLSATLSDFTGAKGFAFNLTAGAIGFDPESTNLQLARSGTATSISGDLKDENLGDLYGMGEFVRRLIPHTSSTSLDYINPMVNQIAPNWLPHDSSRYFNNFQLGDYWSKVDNAEARLPGIGFNKLNQELKDVNPANYPLVYRYKVLSDVAYASPEHLAMKDQLLQLDRKGSLNEQEQSILYEALEKEQIKSQKREFREYKTDEELSKLSLAQRLLTSVWEPIAHNSESILEPLTPFRPGSKFIHARSAIEDYEKTQLQGPDTAIWTNPYSHFIKPAINRSIGLIPGTQIPEEAASRDAVDEYFDKIAYLKARREGNTNAALKTVVGSTFGGIYDVDTMNKFKAGLTADQRMYVDAFAKEADPVKRNKILEMLPSDVSVAYQSIWENIEIAEQAKSRGKNPEEALMQHYFDKTDRFVKAAGGTTDKYATIPRNPDDKFEQAKERRLRAADKVAEDYISQVTGVPKEGWIGWDPRLTAKDIKLRTLTTGKADIFKHGYWDSDVERNERIVALDSTNEVVNDYERIRSSIREERKLKNRIETSLFEKGFHSRRIEISPASRNDIVIRDRQE